MYRKPHLLALAVLGLTSAAVAEVPDLSSRQTPLQPPTPFTPQTASFPAPPRDHFAERQIQARHQAQRK